MIKNAQGVSCSALTPHIELKNQTLLCTGAESTPGMWNADTLSAHTWGHMPRFQENSQVKSKFYSLLCAPDLLMCERNWNFACKQIMEERKFVHDF